MFIFDCGYEDLVKIFLTIIVFGDSVRVFPRRESHWMLKSLGFEDISWEGNRETLLVINTHVEEDN